MSATTTAIRDDAGEDIAPEATNTASENTAPTTDTPAAGIGFGMIALLVAISVVSGAIGAVAYDRYRTPPPRIMVLDMPALIEPISTDASLNEYQKRQITEDLGRALDAAMTQEVEVNGNIVLDASVILRAPESSYVKP